MANISKITLPNDSEYDIKDSLARQQIEAITGVEGILMGYGGAVTAAEAGTDYQTPLTAGTDYIAPPSSPSSGDVLTYNGSSWVASAVPEELFICEYGVTTYADAVAARTAGKTLFAKYYDSDDDYWSYYPLVQAAYMGDGVGWYLIFARVITDRIERLLLDSAIGWDSNTTDLQTSLPSQTSQSGKFLTTNGSSLSWENVPTEIPSQSGNSGKFLKTNGTSVSWASIPNELPSKSGNSGKFLYTDGFDVSWSSLPIEVKVVYYGESYWYEVNGAYNNTMPVLCIAGSIVSSRETYYEAPLTYVVYDDSNPEYVHDFYFTCTTEAGTLLTIKLDTNDTWSYTETPISLPSQSGQSGKYLTTDGSALSWGSISVPTASTTTPSMDGTASYGSGTSYARSNHVHPTDTSRQSKICTGSITTTTTWTGSGPYTQTVTVSNLPTGVSITSNSKVDIQPDATAIAQLVSDSVTGLYVSNTSGTLTVYAVGAAPTAALTLQVTVTEVAS